MGELSAQALWRERKASSYVSAQLSLLYDMFPSGHALLSAYCASKFAVRGLTQTAGAIICSLMIFSVSLTSQFSAIELGRHGITVNAYAPGAIDTSMREFQYHPMISYSNTVMVVAHLQSVGAEHSRDLNEEVTSSTAVRREVQTLISTFYT